jgi:hypothetical protein
VGTSRFKEFRMVDTKEADLPDMNPVEGANARAVLGKFVALGGAVRCSTLPDGKLFGDPGASAPCGF